MSDQSIFLYQRMKNLVVILVGKKGILGYLKAYGLWSLKYLYEIFVPLLIGGEVGKLSVCSSVK